MTALLRASLLRGDYATATGATAALFASEGPSGLAPHPQRGGPAAPPDKRTRRLEGVTWAALELLRRHSASPEQARGEMRLAVLWELHLHPVAVMFLASTELCAAKGSTNSWVLALPCSNALHHAFFSLLNPVRPTQLRRFLRGAAHTFGTAPEVRDKMLYELAVLLWQQARGCKTCVMSVRRARPLPPLP